jgi:hypothetical protein
MFDYTGQQIVAKFRETLAVNKQILHRFHVERLNLKTLNKVEGKEQYHVEVSNRFAAWEVFIAEVDINSASETIRENTLEWSDNQRASRASFPGQCALSPLHPDRFQGPPSLLSN